MEGDRVLELEENNWILQLYASCPFQFIIGYRLNMAKYARPRPLIGLLPLKDRGRAYFAIFDL